MYRTRAFDSGLTLLELPQQKTGFSGFIGSWIYRGPLNIVVDVGPAASIEHLIGYLQEHDIGTIDAVLLTHIHIDHAGGLGSFLKAFPDSMVICHEKALPHLVDPSRLWEASSKTLGEIALMYGEMPPVPRDRLIPHTKANLPGLGVLDTPGHAVHHLCFVYDGILFAGEAAGVHLPYEDPVYLRPSTPPRFILEKALNSIDLLTNLGNLTLCYAHFGKAVSSRKMLTLYRNQLLSWRDILAGESEGCLQGDGRTERCLEAILSRDPLLRGLSHMKPAVRDRERFFLKNCLEGFLGYLDSTGSTSRCRGSNKENS